MTLNPHEMIPRCGLCFGLGQDFEVACFLEEEPFLFGCGVSEVKRLEMASGGKDWSRETLSECCFHGIVGRKYRRRVLWELVQ
ncbi:hypothetical protein AVEN_205366-1 [Araneus ventricosus]|uniref:Uncharacterized protein n=1 Tax=Araneus ventricosus TaxID=182803 RepID=A0A4Y2U8R5_ARAVE|nr:hypothetical protein AVEN_205366-1 [Araneus ventricosus]